MVGEKHMEFTWAFELVAPGLRTVLIAALQKSVTEKDGKLVVAKSELKDTFGKLYGFTKDVVKHFNESVRFLRKSGIISVEKGKETTKVIVARKDQEFLVDEEIENIDVTSDRNIHKYIARKAYNFHVPFRFLIDIINKESGPVHKEVLREILSKEMLAYAMEGRPDYYEKKRNELKKRGKPVDKWKYPLPHFNVFLAIAEKADLINCRGIYVERAFLEKERKISYDQFKRTVLDEYNRILKEHPKILMASIDELRTSTCKTLKISEETFQKMMQALILRNMGKMTVYRQRAKESEKGLRMPDNLMIYAILIKNVTLT